MLIEKAFFDQFYPEGLSNIGREKAACGVCDNLLV